MAELGATLRDARLRRNVSLAEAERDTRVRQVFLAALEQERFDLLPPRTYAQGLLWVYARYLGLDPNPLVEQLPPDQEDGRHQPPQSGGMGWMAAVFFVLLILAVAAIAGVCSAQRLLDR